MSHSIVTKECLTSNTSIGKFARLFADRIRRFKLGLSAKSLFVNDAR